jgi:YVTN family beta-propeller protein
VSPHLEFRILGPLELRLDGAPVPVGGPRQRALLALLLCNANRVVSRDQLIDELLHDQAAASAERTLRVQVSRLRKVLASGDGESRLIARPPGYLLRVDAGELDLHDFERRVIEGRCALEDDDPGQAAARLREAESLWRGRPLADLESEPFARFEVQRLEELRLGVVEERIEAELALGRDTSLCAELESLVAEHPLRERLRAQLMLALYRCGRQAEALGTYRAGRSLLVKELGLEPSPELKRLEGAILRQDVELQWRECGPPAGAAADLSALAEAPRSPVPSSQAPPDGDRRRRVRWAALGLGMAVAFVALAGLAIAPGPESSARRPTALNANVLALISPGSGAVRATVPLQAPPTDVAAGFGSLWVTEADAGLVVRVDPTRRAVIATIPVGTSPSRIVTASGRVWVLDTVDRTVSAIDPNSDTVAQTVAAGSDPRDIAVSAGSLWVADHGKNIVLRIDPGTGRIQSIVRTGSGPSGLAAAGAAVWVANDGSGAVERIDARTGEVTNTIRVGDAPAAIAATTAEVWVLDPLDSTLSRIDPTRNAVQATVPLAGAPTSLTLLGGLVWVADQQQGTLLRFDPRSDSVTSTIRLGADPRALAAANGLWAAVGNAGADHRGGTLTSISSYEILDTIDPAASNSPNVVPPQLSGLTNDGLVTLDHVAGPNGARLVPDLALALPEPSDNGRTYTFALRPGIYYSTGAVVQPIDVTHSFERLFAMGSSGTSFYQSIRGAPSCLRTPSRCDLSRGIVADEHANTVTFHLTQPDPNFLYKMTIAYADVLPASTPNREARTPLPATGPYMIARYLPGRELQLIRNPRFREWSAAAQPAGYPDKIVMPLHLDGAHGGGAIADGEGDFMANIGEIPGPKAAHFLSHHRRQVHVNPIMITGFMFLNVNAAPFNDIRVRRAVNLALDRRAVVNSYGGPIAARPTCQILPPGLPGYRPYCPYTLGPDAIGRWHRPDLAAARRLVAASGTKGMKVTVWNINGPPQAAVDETRHAVAALDQLSSTKLQP